jgi:hypothetical protein
VGGSCARRVLAKCRTDYCPTDCCLLRFYGGNAPVTAKTRRASPAVPVALRTTHAASWPMHPGDPHRPRRAASPALALPVTGERKPTPQPFATPIRPGAASHATLPSPHLPPGSPHLLRGSRPPKRSARIPAREARNRAGGPDIRGEEIHPRAASSTAGERNLIAAPRKWRTGERTPKTGAEMPVSPAGKSTSPARMSTSPPP